MPQSVGHHDAQAWQEYHSPYGTTWFYNESINKSVWQLFVGPYWSSTGRPYFEDRARRHTVWELPVGSDYVLVRPRPTRRCHYPHGGAVGIYFTPTVAALHQKPGERSNAIRLPDLHLWQVFKCPQGRPYFWQASDHRMVWNLFIGPFWSKEGAPYYDDKATDTLVWALPPGIDFVLEAPSRWDITATAVSTASTGTAPCTISAIM